eukprot:6422182-Pyramimonas_sp.AAC.1
MASVWYAAQRASAVQQRGAQQTNDDQHHNQHRDQKFHGGSVYKPHSLHDSLLRYTWGGGMATASW